MVQHEIRHWQRGESTRGYEFQYNEEWEKCAHIIYWYEQGDYDGCGFALYTVDPEDGWHITDLSHCSCYGPFEDRLDHGRGRTLAALAASCTREAYDREYGCLIEYAMAI